MSRPERPLREIPRTPMRELLTRRRWIEIARIAVAGVAPLPVLLGAGTLTMGRPEVGRIQVLDPSVTEDVVLRLAAAAERRSSHFFADAVIAAAKSRKLEVAEPADFEVVRGRGVRATVDVGIAMGAVDPRPRWKPRTSR